MSSQKKNWKMIEKDTEKDKAQCLHVTSGIEYYI